MTAALLAASFTALAPPRPAHAATITVNSAADNTTAGDGDCTLREAINNANDTTDGQTTVGDCAARNPRGADTITLPAGTYTLRLAGHSEADNATGDLDLKSDITINGADADTTIIDGDQSDRVMEVFGGASVELNNLTIANGKGQDAASIAHGQGGGIHNAGTLTIQDCVIKDNLSGKGSGSPNVAKGGGVYSSGTLTIRRSTIRGNAAHDSYTTGADGGDGGGIYAEGSLTIENSRIENNTAGDGYTDSEGGSGGGIYIASGTIEITDTTITGNSSGANSSSYYDTGHGGGVAAWGGTTTIENSTISNNTTPAGPEYDKDGDGGGIALGSGSMTVTNSTISGNQAAGGGGGAVASGGTLDLIHTTITSNTGDSDNDGTGEGGGLSEAGGTINIKNSIVAKNDDLGGADDSSDDCHDTITSQGYNLVGNGTGCPSGGTNQTTGNPGLGPLGDNGGPTHTHALLSGSPALDAIPNGTNGCGSDYTSDQRGEPRPSPAGGNCDIGSFESAFREIDVRGNNQSIADGDNTPDTADHTDFGEADVNTEAITYTFTISNTGVIDLNLDGTPRVEIGGAGADAFSLTAAPDATIAPGSSTTFQITFDPADTDLQTAVVVITSDDTDENPYVFSIQGTGTGTPNAVILKSLAARSLGRVLSGILVALVWGVSAGGVGLGGWRLVKQQRTTDHTADAQSQNTKRNPK